LRQFRHWLAIVAITLVSVAAAGDPAVDRNEINGLLGRIEQSSCRFMRNGSGYTGHEAAEHLRTKWQVAERRGSNSLTVEQFIAQVASSSSMSGRPYEVDCDGDGQSSLSEWLQKALAALRNVAPALNSSHRYGEFHSPASAL
jgi:Family of unknown function (DUF5329)